MLFDVKHYTREGYLNITGQPMDESLRFLQAVQEFNIPLWIRHVAVPGLTDSREHLMGLFEAVKQIKNVQKVELLLIMCWCSQIQSYGNSLQAGTGSAKRCFRTGTMAEHDE